ICSPIEGRYAVPLDGKRQAVRRKRFGRLRVMMRCRAAAAHTTTTTTLPFGTPDLYGHWMLSDDGVVDGCPAPIGQVLAQDRSPHPVELVQRADTLRLCLDGHVTFGDETVPVSPAGFTFDIAACCEAIGGGYDYAYGERFTAGASNSDGSLPVVHEYMLT